MSDQEQAIGAAQELEERVRLEMGAASSASELKRYLELPDVRRAILESNPDRDDDFTEALIRSAFTYPVGMKADDVARLFACSKQSWARALMMAASLQLTCERTNAIGYLVPRGQVLYFEPGYGGLLDVAWRTGLVETLSCQVVRDGDAFEVQLGSEPFVHHTPLAKGGKDYIGAYAVVWLKGARFPIVENLDREDIDRLQALSKSGKHGPWGSWPDQMARAKALRRALKRVPSGPQLRRALSMLDAGDDVDMTPRNVLDSVADAALRGEKPDADENGAPGATDEPGATNDSAGSDDAPVPVGKLLPQQVAALREEAERAGVSWSRVEQVYAGPLEEYDWPIDERTRKAIVDSPETEPLETIRADVRETIARLMPASLDTPTVARLRRTIQGAELSEADVCARVDPDVATLEELRSDQQVAALEADVLTAIRALAKASKS